MYRRIKNSNIPYTSITKETWLSLVKTLEMDQIGQIITAMYDYIYTGKEPSFNSKVMNGQWDMLIENVERMSKGYFSKADNGVASAKKRIENKKKNQVQPETNIPIEPNDDFNVEPVENISCNVEPQEEQINNNNNPKPEEEMGNLTNIIIKEGKALVINEPAVEYRNNSIPTLSNRIQETINTDENFCKVYANCTKRIAHYRINNTDICASNSIEMAYDKLERMFDEYHIPFNTEANEFIENDINDIIKMMED